MATPYSAHYLLDLGIKCDEADLANGDVVVIGAICPYAGVIKAVWVGTRVKPTTATLAVAKSASTNVNVLTASTVDINALTAHVAASQTLATTATSLEVAAGDMLVGTWTLASITASNDSGYACTVVIEPFAW
jgi:hypothetical protein